MFISLLGDLGGQFEEETKCNLLLGYVDQSEALRPEAAAWRRMRAGDPCRRFQWLLDGLDREVTRQDQERNLAIRRRYVESVADGSLFPSYDGKGGRHAPGCWWQWQRKEGQVQEGWRRYDRCRGLFGRRFNRRRQELG